MEMTKKKVTSPRQSVQINSRTHARLKLYCSLLEGAGNDASLKNLVNEVLDEYIEVSLTEHPEFVSSFNAVGLLNVEEDSKPGVE